MPLKDVYICTADPSGQIVAIRKDKGKKKYKGASSMKRLTACIIILTVIAAMSVFSVFAVKKKTISS